MLTFDLTETTEQQDNYDEDVIYASLFLNTPTGMTPAWDEGKDPLGLFEYFVENNVNGSGYINMGPDTAGNNWYKKGSTVCFWVPGTIDPPVQGYYASRGGVCCPCYLDTPPCDPVVSCPDCVGHDITSPEVGDPGGRINWAAGGGGGGGEGFTIPPQGPFKGDVKPGGKVAGKPEAPVKNNNPVVRDFRENINNIILAGNDPWYNGGLATGEFIDKVLAGDGGTALKDLWLSAKGMFGFPRGETKTVVEKKGGVTPVAASGSPDVPAPTNLTIPYERLRSEPKGPTKSQEFRGNGVDKNFTGILAYREVEKGESFTILTVNVDDITETWTCDESGNLTGSNGGSGTLNDVTGVVTLNSVKPLKDLSYIVLSYTRKQCVNPTPIISKQDTEYAYPPACGPVIEGNPVITYGGPVNSGDPGEADIVTSGGTMESDGGVKGDPHFEGFDNLFDFHGQAGKIYQLYKNDNITMNAKMGIAYHCENGTFLEEIYIASKKDNVPFEVLWSIWGIADAQHFLQMKSKDFPININNLTYSTDFEKKEYALGNWKDQYTAELETDVGNFILILSWYLGQPCVNFRFTPKTQDLATGILGQTTNMKVRLPNELFEVDYTNSTNLKHTITPDMYFPVKYYPRSTGKPPCTTCNDKLNSKEVYTDEKGEKWVVDETVLM